MWGRRCWRGLQREDLASLHWCQAPMGMLGMLDVLHSDPCVCVCAREISGKCGGISECPWRVYSGALYKHQQYSSWAKCTNRFSVQSQRASSYRACRASSLLCLGFKAELIQVFIKILTLYLSVCEPLMRKYLRESRSALDAEFGVWNWEQMFIV